MNNTVSVVEENPFPLSLNIRERGIFLIFYVRYSTLLRPPLRFHCVRGCWDRTQDRLRHWLSDALNICTEACCKKDVGVGGVAPLPLTSHHHPIFQLFCGYLIYSKDDVPIFLLLGVSSRAGGLQSACSQASLRSVRGNFPVILHLFLCVCLCERGHQ